jgi:hypothetical protein
MEKYPYIEQNTARALIERAQKSAHTKTGAESDVWVLGDYVVLKSCRLGLRNVEIKDTNCAHLDDVIKTLMQLSRAGVAVVPILGYRYNERSKIGKDSFVIQRRAAGAELWETQKLQDRDYVLEHLKLLAAAPQEHFDKFLRDLLKIAERDILVDCLGKDNFFYDTVAGFQFIDINCHTDYYYKLDTERRPATTLAFRAAFLPCYLGGWVPPHYETEKTFPFLPKTFTTFAEFLKTFSADELHRTKTHNQTVFNKCKNALVNIGIGEREIADKFKSGGVFVWGVDF